MSPAPTPHTPAYEISSFQDIIDKVPFERIEVMMAELGEVLAMTAATIALARASAEDSGTVLPEELCKLQLPLVWKDDNKETHTLEMSNIETGERVATMTLAPSAAALSQPEGESNDT